MAIPPVLIGKVAEAAEGIVGGLMKGFDNLFTSKEEKAAKVNELEKIKAEITAKANEHMLEFAKLNFEETKAYLEDLANARNMQIEALKQDDKFAKRFIYYFTMGLTGITLAFDFCFFFVTYPERNHDLINMIAGILNTGCLMSIISFFYGDSHTKNRDPKQIDNK